MLKGCAKRSLENGETLYRLDRPAHRIRSHSPAQRAAPAAQRR